MVGGRNEPLRGWKQKSKPGGNHGQARLKMGCCRSAAEGKQGKQRGSALIVQGLSTVGTCVTAQGRLCNVTVYALPLFYMHVPLSVVLNPLSRLV